MFNLSLNSTFSMSQFYLIQEKTYEIIIKNNIVYSTFFKIHFYYLFVITLITNTLLI